MPYSKLYECNNKKYCAGGFGSYSELQKRYMKPNIYKFQYIYPQYGYYPPEDFLAKVPCTQTDLKINMNKL